MTVQLKQFSYELGDGEDVEATVTYNCEVINGWTRNLAALFTPPPPRRFKEVIVGWALERNNSPGAAPATLQLCVGSRCLIIHLSYLSNIPISLLSFLANPNVVCVGMMEEDEKKELFDKHGISCAKTFDVRVLGTKYMPRKVTTNSRFETLAWHILNLEVPKPNWITSTDWDIPELSDEQINYACLNAFACYHIGYMVLEKLILVTLLDP